MSAVPMPVKEPLLRVRDLVKHFPVKGGVFQRQVDKVHAVDGVSFEIAAGAARAPPAAASCA
jgi:oligopeptide transport system ATP-binding protein